jgi:hypothetical protein
MREFTLRLNPPANAFAVNDQIPVCLTERENVIGLCHIGHDDVGMVGRFTLNENVQENHFVLYDFHMPDTPQRELSRIIFSNEAQNANTIGNSLV